MEERILLVEDERGLVVTLGDRLHSEGYQIETAGDGKEGLERATREPFDLIVLDVMLPRKNGLEVCRDLRQQGMTMPILMLTARTQTIDKVLGLKLGADDYVTKPFEMHELLARIEALLRRAPSTPLGPGVIHQLGPIRVDLRRAEVAREAKPVGLTAREFQLLRYFLGQRGATLSRKELLKEIWGYNAATSTRTVDVHVAGLRQKLEKDPGHPKFILTVTGLGYKFAS